MNIALIVAAGSGTRMGQVDKPKQFLLVNNKPLMVYTLEAFEHNENVDAIIVVTNKEYIDTVKDFGVTKVKSVVAGGETRQDSVFNGLKEAKAIGESTEDIILIHDAARPLVSQKIINDNIEACKKYGSAVTAIKAADTIVKSNEEIVNDIPARKELYQVQTPQTFKLSVIYNAHLKAKEDNIPDVTDDTKLVHYLGHEVHLVEGDKLNFKITTQEDLKLFEALLK